MSCFFKRAFDIFFAVVVLTLLFPFFIITAIIIVVCSPGNPFYCAKRVGKNGEIFTCFKFRSMRVDSGNVRLTTLSNDERIFSFGKIIRKTKIDELPQVFNILIGNMSVVGPRPEDKDNVDKIYIGRFRRILDVKPGLTSPASLYDYTEGEKYENIKQYEVEFLPKKLELELYYIDHAKFFYDIAICFRTLLVVLQVVTGCKRIKPPKELDKIESVIQNRNDTTERG